MFDRFTDRARKVIGLARQEAQRFNHDYIGTEHILLGLARERSGVAAAALKNLGIDPGKVCEEVERLVQPVTSMVTVGQLPFTARAKKVLEFSLEEASNLGHTYIGTEHLLLGLIREGEGIAAQVLRNLKVKVEDVREEVLELLDREAEDPMDRPPPTEERTDSARVRWRDGALFGAVAAEVLDHAATLAGVVGGSVEPVHVFFGVAAATRKHPELAKRTRGLVDLGTFEMVAERRPGIGVTGAYWRRVDLAPATLAVLSVAFAEAAGRGDSIVHADDLLVALLSAEDGEPSRLLRRSGVDPAALREAVRTARRPPPESAPDA